MAALIERVLDLQPRLQRALDRSPPEEVSRQLGSVTVHQLEAVACLPPQGASMKQFAELAGISGAAATAIADRMVNQGLVERRDHPGDRRSVWLAPTLSATHALETFRGWQRDYLSTLFARLAPGQLATLVEVLAVLLELESP